MTKEKGSSYKLVIENRKARFRYELIETLEVGLVLLGTEIKSIREGKVNIAEAYIRPSSNGMQILGMHIEQYSHSGEANYQPERPRSLLLHKKEADSLAFQVKTGGLTIVPVKLYLARGLAKLQIALARGKNVADKRGTIKARESEREIKRKFKLA